MAKSRFTIVLIKPSHYDDDGYVIQWRRETRCSSLKPCRAGGRRILQRYWQHFVG